MKKILLTSLAVLAALGLGFAAPADDANDAVIKAQKPSYPLRTCVVSGKAFNKDVQPIAHVAMKRLMLLCSEECVKKVTENPEPYVAKINAAVIEQQTPIYPLTTCVVSGEELGSMGAPIDVVHGTRLVRLCCKGCRKKLTDSPDAFIAKVDEKLVETLRASYPMQKCVVTGNALPAADQITDKLYGVTLVRLCCKDCKAAFEREPKALAFQVQNAMKGARKEGGKDAPKDPPKDTPRDGKEGKREKQG